MFKINSKNIFGTLIIGLGILLIIIALGIVSSRTAGKNKPAENSPVASVNKNQAPEANFKIVYILNKGEGQEILKFDYILHKGEKQTVFDVLKDLSQTKGFDLKYNNNYPQYGVFIESIAGIANEKTNGGKAWQFWINGKLGEAAADKQELKAGDKIEWIYKETPKY